MDYIGIDEAAKKWGVSKRFVQILCADGRIEGATRLGRAWMIPENAKKPIDGRTRAARTEYALEMCRVVGCEDCPARGISRVCSDFAYSEGALLEWLRGED